AARRADEISPPVAGYQADKLPRAQPSVQDVHHDSGLRFSCARVIRDRYRPHIQLLRTAGGRKPMATSTTAATMKGSVLGVILHDICEEIRLNELREILGAKRVEPGFKHATPEYVRFEKPPVVERLDPVVLSSGETLSPQVKYYDYGVVSVVLELGFEADWEELIQLAARWVPNAELERQAQEIIRGRLERIAPAIGRLYNDWLSEDYYIFLLSDVPSRANGSELLAEYGPQIAQMLRGEQVPLARSEADDVIQASLS